MSIVGTPEWDAACAAYVQQMAALTPGQKAHANCDHAYGYCTQTPTNTFGA